MLACDFGNGGGADAVTEIAVHDNAGAAALCSRSAIGRCGYGAVDWQELSVSSRGMSSASCYSFNLCRRDKELLFDSECFADGERLKFYEVPVTAEELTPLDKLIQLLPWQLRQPSASRPANLPREMIEVRDCGSFSLTLLTATGEKLVCRTDIEQQQELLRELQRLAKQVHEQKRDAGHEKMHPMRGFRLFRELPEK